ncbi:MAG: hypothetical protein DIU80_020100 [Chloroflexota bacterium]|nr:MAG: hypothetical protein DIU80_03840 [Chloroflexota bacterium]
MTHSQLEVAKRQLDAALRALDAELGGAVEQQAEEAVAAPAASGAEAPVSTLRTFARLVLGTALLGLDELARRGPAWEQRAASQAGEVRPRALPAEAAAAGTGVRETIRQALTGWIFLTEERLQAARSPAELIRLTASHLASSAAALSREALHTTLDGGSHARDPEIARWVARGAVEERHSRVLAQVALGELFHDGLEWMSKDPALQELVQSHSTSLAAEALEEVRERAVSADLALDHLVERLFRVRRAQPADVAAGGTSEVGR